MVAGNLNWNTQTDIDYPLINAWRWKKDLFLPRRTSRLPPRSSCSARSSAISCSTRRQSGRPTIRIQHLPFTIIGVMATRDSPTSVRSTTLPLRRYTTVMKKMRNITFVQRITVSAASAGEVSVVADRVASLLRVRHKIQNGDPDDFMVRTIEEMASVRKKRHRL
jgi:ABC-type antimicrobial peptide transport system permease subunit